MGGVGYRSILWWGGESPCANIVPMTQPVGGTHVRGFCGARYTSTSGGSVPPNEGWFARPPEVGVTVGGTLSGGVGYDTRPLVAGEKGLG